MILENGEYDLTKLFALIAELGESLNENRSLSVALYTQATNVKVGVVWSFVGVCGGSKEARLVVAGYSFTVRIRPTKVCSTATLTLFQYLHIYRFNLDKTQGLAVLFTSRVVVDDIMSRGI